MRSKEGPVVWNCGLAPQTFFWPSGELVSSLQQHEVRASEHGDYWSDPGQTAGGGQRSFPTEALTVLSVDPVAEGPPPL